MRGLPPRQMLAGAAIKLVAEHWPAILALATELARRGRLERDEIAALIG